MPPPEEHPHPIYIYAHAAHGENVPTNRSKFSAPTPCPSFLPSQSILPRQGQAKARPKVREGYKVAGIRAPGKGARATCRFQGRHARHKITRQAGKTDTWQARGRGKGAGCLAGKVIQIRQLQR